MKPQPRIKGFVLVIFSTMLWGVSGTVAQYLFQQKGFSPEWLVVIRLLISGIVLLSFATLRGNKNVRKIWSSKYTIFNLICFALIGMLGVQYTYFAAIKHGNAATATILQYLYPVIIIFYMTIRTKKAPSSKEIIAISLTILGTFLIITKGNVSTLSISKIALFWGVTSAFAAAFYTLQPVYLLARYDSITVVGWGMFIGGIGFSFIQKPWVSTGQWSVSSILAIIFVVLFGTLIAFCCYLESLKYIKPIEVSILSSIEPLSAAFLSVFWLHVNLGIFQWLGTACIIFAIIYLSFTKKAH
ncbi:DMT family transporter [Clostridium folliculivorans]|uniref:Permease n=1 Tax=Clostridium folliculivorans TaxID=2886038 RepID=A0A9W5Y1D3_9CLOT|nr:EamA family transporter [Clostridium folliculivorans]GKU24954.1 permease [Clostridium folliculivorans]GKU31052.1 permease [Clostridium folliculivorans]